MIRSRRARTERDRGAVIPLMALVLVTLITMTAITVDLGRLMVNRRDMQALADVVALDLARDINGGTKASYDVTNPASLINVHKNQSVLNNHGTPANVTFELGQAGGKGQPFVSIADTATPNAVKVTSKDNVTYFFAQVIGQTSGNTSRSATAGINQHACFSVGSYAAAITPAGSAMGPLLSQLLTGNSGTISLVSYQGLATANLTLLDLLNAQNSVGTVDGLLASSYTADQYRILEAKALRNKGDIANATILEGLNFSAAGSSTTKLGDLLNVATGDSSAASASFKVLELLAGSVYVSNGTNFVNVPSISVLNVATVQLKLIEAPQLGCSPKTARTSQVSLHIVINVPLVANVDLTYQIAPATATFGGAVCGTTKNTATVNVNSSLMATHVKVTALLGLVLTDTDLGAGTEAGGPPLTFDINRTVANPTGSIPPDPTQTKSNGGGSLGIEATNLNSLSLSGVIVATVGTSLNALVTPLLKPLQQLAGISIGGADVTLNEFDCRARALVG